MLDRQAVFERVAAHLIAQGQPAVVLVGDDRICAYRTTSGLRCAIGALIADDVFDPEFNDAPVAHPGVLAMLLGSGLDIDMARDDLDFLSDLQAVHDSVDAQGGRRLTRVMQRLDEFRQRHGLQVVPVAACGASELA